MTAREASEKANGFGRNSEYDKIINNINESASKGRFSFNNYDLLKDVTVDKLMKDGFEVNQGIDGRNESYCNISW